MVNYYKSYGLLGGNIESNGVGHNEGQNDQSTPQNGLGFVCCCRYWW